MIHERRLKLAEIELEVAVEMRGVWLLVRQRRFTVHDEAMHAEEIMKQRGEVGDRGGKVVRLLCARPGGDGEDAQHHHREALDHSV